MQPLDKNLILGPSLLLTQVSFFTDEVFMEIMLLLSFQFDFLFVASHYLFHICRVSVFQFVSDLVPVGAIV